MPFSQSTITDVRFQPIPSQALVRVIWSSTSPDGTAFQVYANAQLVWHGTERQADFPWPTSATNYEVGAVGPGEESTDFAASLPPQPPQGRALLSWHGGLYLDQNLTGFRIYGEATPGAGINYTTPIATVPAQVGSSANDGLGGGGFGGGGFGSAEVSYSWLSDPLPKSGTYNFAVKAVNAAGNESTVVSVAVAVIRPPRPPAPDSQGRRLTYTYDQTTRKVTLHWKASPL